MDYVGGAGSGGRHDQSSAPSLSEQYKVKVKFPSKAQILRLIEAAKAGGMSVGAVRLSPTGDVTIMDKSTIPANDSDDELSKFV